MLAVAAGACRTVEHHRGLRDFPRAFGVVARGRPGRAIGFEPRGDRRQRQFLVLPTDPPRLVGTDHEDLPGGLPLPVAADRIGLAVDDMHQRLAEVPAPAVRHHVEHVVEMGGPARGAPRPGAEQAVGGAQAEFHRPERLAVGGIDRQRRTEFVADVVLVGAAEAVGVGGGVGDHRPVVDDQRHRRGGSADGGANGVLGGLDQRRQRDGLVVEEAAHGLDGGHGLGRAKC